MNFPPGSGLPPLCQGPGHHQAAGPYLYVRGYGHHAGWDGRLNPACQTY